MDKISDRLDSHERRIRGARAELHELGKEIGEVEDHINARLDMVSRFLDQFMTQLDSLDGRVVRHQEAADRTMHSQDQFMFLLNDRLALVEHEQLEIRSELAEIRRRLDALPATERHRYCWLASGCALAMAKRSRAIPCKTAAAAYEITPRAATALPASHDRALGAGAGRASPPPWQADGIDRATTTTGGKPLASRAS